MQTTGNVTRQARITHCSACGQDHEDVTFVKLPRYYPSKARGLYYRWSAKCPVSGEMVYAWDLEGIPPDEDSLVLPESSGKLYYPCKYCGMNEDGPHKADCPADAPALLARVKVLERQIADLVNAITGGK